MTELKLRPGTTDRDTTFEVKEYDALGIGPGDEVLDIGANIGAFSRRALEQGARFVTAVEPHPENYKALKENLTGFPARAVQAAVVGHNVPGGVELFVGGTETTHSTVAYRGRERTITVPAIRFCDLLADVEPTVVKIDIEGAEYDLDYTDLPNVRAIAVEFHMSRKEWREERVPEITEDLAAQGFKMVHSRGFDSRSPRTCVGVWQTRRYDPSRPNR